MAELIQVVNDREGRRIPATGTEIVIGRARDVTVSIDDARVSRRHARIWQENGRQFIEDLGSSNGTFVNGQRLNGKTGLRDRDLILVGGHLFRFHDDPVPAAEMTIVGRTSAASSNTELFRQDAAGKLRAVLDLSHHLARALDTETVLSRLLDQLLVLFPHAERAQAVFPDDTGFVVRASRAREGGEVRGRTFSRSLVQEVVSKRVAVLAADTGQMENNQTLGTLGIHSLLAVPMQTRAGRTLGVIVLDRYQSTRPFNPEDLNLLTAVVLQACSALENAALHEELLVKERIDGELKLAREIQNGFLPAAPPVLAAGTVDLRGDLEPAQEIAGDFYDYLALDDRHLAFYVADVSGKGMPAALFMAATRVLLREAIQVHRSPAEILARLNHALSRNNPKFMFVTVLLGIQDTATGHTRLARAGHPPAVLRRADGRVTEIDGPPGQLAGVALAGDSPFADVTLELDPGDSLLLYTDGLTEAVAPEGGTLFGTERLLEAIRTLPAAGPLGDWNGALRNAVQSFSGGRHLADDLTLLWVRRPRAGQ